MVSIGSLELGKRPCVAAVIDDIVLLDMLSDLKRKGIALFEVRVDLIDQPLGCIVRYMTDVKQRIGLPLIGTVRENERTSESRAVIFEKIIPIVDCIDVELGPLLPAQALAAAAGKTIIVSEHDFDKTPDEEGLASIVDRAVAQGADIVKVVTMARSGAEAWRLLRFAEKCPSPIVAFAMGEHGKFSRRKACDHGSLFTYGYITGPVAPGQLSAEELAECLFKIGPAEGDSVPSATTP